MRVSAAMLADAATVAEGKLYVHGAGWDTIQSPGFPVTHPSLSVAFVLELQWNESNVDRTISVTLHDDDGTALGPGAAGAINFRHPPDAVDGAPILTPFALTFAGLKFEHPGRYSFRLVIDQTEYAQVGFSVRRPLTPNASRP